MFEAVLFDFGGVVMRMDSGPKLRAWLKRLNLSEEEVDQFLWGNPAAPLAMKGQMSALEFWKMVGKQLGLDGEETQVFKADYFSNANPDVQILGLVRKLREEGVKVGLLSNTMDDAEQAFDDMGLWHYFDDFDTVVLSHREGMAKPEPAIYLLACQRLEVKPSNAIHIDDLYRNVDGARVAGLAGWHYCQSDLDKLREFLLEGK